ncbi:FadR/GntR family transcriptional regulator [Chelatococcus sp. SYSU_G07232]|uniref:FadR/GntR family transcriptional regulator n=1 Tax=Chelatococcus albus TaxID=3047466 RepID=A0ABT7AJK5_9HYPH|nr:FadR/GntR family transcriptional regulator [Chelatococcus sp. SYSU_G07232]MDJ1159172.1 FadR/GntR family transcriptional regulator [Chelatococcus sp. SYSU_G07232]
MEPRTAHQAVVDAIARDIVTGRYRPGDTLPTEPELCAAYAVSRTTVREALKTLTAKGIVSVRPKTGTRVRPHERWSLLDPEVVDWRLASGVDGTLVRDIVDMRLIIEPEAAALAAERAGEADIAALRGAFSAMTEAAYRKGSYVEADLAFHRALLHAARNQFLSQLVPIVTGMLRLSFELSVVSREAAIASLTLHEAVLDAIAAGTPDAARDATRILIVRARGDIEGRPGFRP